MKIAVFSDIHGNYEALKSILKDIKNNNIDNTIFLGDSIALGPNSEECIKLLNEENIINIYGNHELYTLKGIDIDPYININNIEHCEYIETLNLKQYTNNMKLKYEIEFNNKKILFAHYFLTNNEYPYHSLDIFKDNSYKEKLKDINYDYVFYGHEHEIEYHELNNKKFYGVGSSGCTRNNTTYYHLITIINNEINVNKINITYDRNKLIESFNSKKYPQREQIAYKLFDIDTNELK